MKRENIEFEVDGQKVSSKLFIPKVSGEGYPGLIIAHDRKESKDRYDSVADDLMKDENIGVLLLDFRGHGDSEGTLGKQTLRDGLKDLRGGFEVLKEKEQIDHKSLGLVGEGFGGYLSSLFGKEVEAESLMLVNPAVYKDEWMDLMYRNFPLKDVKEFRSKINFVEIKSVKAIRKYTGDLLVVGDQEKSLSPGTVVKAYYDNAISANKREIKTTKKDKEEGREIWQEELDKFLKDWFSKTLT